MKRILSVLSVLLLTLVLFACQEKVDGAEQKLETAYSRMDALFADPSNITANFVMPGALAEGVKAEWSSDQPGVISFVIGTDGTVTGTVNRPNMGDGDVKVKVTAILSLKSELSDEMLTKEWSIQLTVKENTVAVIEGYMGIKSSFVRTPKFNISNKKDAMANKYDKKSLSIINIMEGILFVVFTFTALNRAFYGDFGMVPFHLMLGIGYGSVFFFSVKEVRDANKMHA